MDLSLGLVFVSVFLLSFLLLNRRRNLPPGPLSLPLVGSISLLRKFQHQRPHLVLSDAAKTYGDVMSVWYGSQLIIVLRGFDTVHEALVKQADVFSGRPVDSSFLRRLFPEDGGKGKGVLFNDHGHKWRSLRRFTLQVLRDFGVGKSSIEEKIFAEIDAVTSRFEMLEGQSVNINMYLQNVISNVIYSIVFGKRYDYEDPIFETVARITRVAVQGQAVFNLGNFLPECILRIINKKVLGDKAIVYADRGKLVFVEATLLEIQRMSTILPNNVIHCTTKDTVFHGYNIPKGAIVLPGIYSTSRDTKYWKSPDIFQPERFIDESGKLLQNKAMIPFSTGPRQCLGEPLARMELFMVFANLLQRFNFEPEDKAMKHSFESVMFQTINAPIPYNTRVYKRS